MTNPNSAAISDEFLAQLKDDLVCRRVGRGMARLEDHRQLLTSFDPEKKHAGMFAGYLAQWVDLGFERPVLVKNIVARFSKAVRARLPLHDYLHLRMAEGMDRKSTRLNSSHGSISYAVFCLKKKKKKKTQTTLQKKKTLPNKKK